MSARCEHATVGICATCWAERMTCPRHGEIEPCTGNGHCDLAVAHHCRCDPSIPHCPTCGRTLKEKS